MKKIVLVLSLLAFVASACSVREEMAGIVESETSELVQKEVAEQVQETNKAIAGLRQVNDSLRNYVLAVEGNLNALDDKERQDYKTLDANLDDIGARTAALAKSIEDLQAYVNEKSTEEQKWMDAISITLDKLYEIKSEVAGIQTDITDIRSQISDLGDRCDGLQAGIDQANTDIAALNTDLTALEAKEAQDVQTINSSISDLSSTVSNLSTTVTNNYTELKGYIDDINGDITDLYGQISSLDDKIGAETSAREAAISAINSQISTINGQIETINSGISALTDRVEANENSISTLNALTQTMHATLNDCCTNITNLTDRMNAVEGRMTTAETDIDTLYNRTEKLSQKIENIVSTVQSMTLVPDCSDGSVEVVNGQNVLYFDVRPTSIAKTLAQDVQKTVFTMTGYSAKTKSSIGDPVDLPVDAVNYNDTKKLLEVTVNTSNLGDNFFNGNEGANAVLAVKSGKIDKSSEYFPLFAYVHVQSVSLPSSMSFNVDDIYQFVPTFNPPKATNQNVVWSIHDASDPTKKTVAQISSAGLMNALKEGKSTVTVETEDGNKKASCTVTIMTGVVAVTGISLDKDSITVNSGAGAQTILATIIPDNATNQNVLWSTSNAAVATVSNGVVSFVGGGEAVITARAQADPSISATCVVTVKVPVTGVQFDPDDITIPVGQSQVLSYKVMPENATDKNVTLSVSTAKYSGSHISLNPSTGEVTAVSVGTSQVKILTNQGGETDICTIHCTQVPTSVSLSPSSAQTIKMKGGTQVFTASVLPAGASQDVVWESSNPAVATVIETQAGTATVTAKASGETTIIATAKGTNIKASVKVNVVLVTGISMVLNSGMSALGYLPGLDMDDDQLKVTVTPATATQTVTFSSSNNSIATVDASGYITVNGPGTVTFTATASDGTATKSELTIPIYHLNKKLSWDDISSGESNYPQPNPAVAATGYCGTGTSWTSYEYGWGEPDWCNPYSSGKSGISAAATKRNNFLYRYSYMMDGNSKTCYCTSFDIWANNSGWTLATARQTSPHYIQLNFKNSYKAIAFRFMNPTQDFCRLTKDYYPAIKVNGTTHCFDYYVSGEGGAWNTYQYWFIAKSSEVSSIRIQPYAVKNYSSDWIGFINDEKSGWQQLYGCFGIAEIEIYVADQ